MSRTYRLSKRIPADQLSEILREMQEIPSLFHVSYNENENCLKVTTDDDKYYEVMSRAVNICRRVANGAELSFSGFVF